MTNTSLENTLSPSERQFADFVMRGDDFFKIGLLRHAKNCYKKALELKIETEKIGQKLAECNKELAFERKVKLILIAVAVAAIIAYFLING